MAIPAAPAVPGLAEPPGCCVAACCDFNTMYAGRSITVDMVIETANQRATSRFTGGHIGGGVFGGVLTPQTLDVFSAYTDCGVPAATFPQAVPAPVSPVSCTISCSLVGGVPVYTAAMSDPGPGYGEYVLSTALADYNQSLLVNCGVPSCGGTQEVICTALYASDCMSVAMDRSSCVRDWSDPGCSGSILGIATYDRFVLSALIA